ARHRGELPPGVTDVASLASQLRDHQYLTDDGLATAIFLALRLARPLLLEGEAGVGKTEVAKTLADLYGTELIRLQCYEGIDVTLGSVLKYREDHERVRQRGLDELVREAVRRAG